MTDELLALLKGAKKACFRTMYLSYIDRSGQPFAFGEFTKTDLDAHVSMVEELLREHEKLMGFLQDGSAERDKDLSMIAKLIKENAELKSKLLQEDLETAAHIARLIDRNTELAVENARVRYLLQHGPVRGGDGGAAGEPGKPGK